MVAHGQQDSGDDCRERDQVPCIVRRTDWTTWSGQLHGHRTRAEIHRAQETSTRTRRRPGFFSRRVASTCDRGTDISQHQGFVLDLNLHQDASLKDVTRLVGATAKQRRSSHDIFNPEASAVAAHEVRVRDQELLESKDRSLTCACYSWNNQVSEIFPRATGSVFVAKVATPAIVYRDPSRPQGAHPVKVSQCVRSRHCIFACWSVGTLGTSRMY